MAAVPELWAPCLVLSHVFALFWLVKSMYLTNRKHSSKRTESSKKPDPGAPTDSTAGPAAAAEEQRQHEACCTITLNGISTDKPGKLAVEKPMKLAVSMASLADLDHADVEVEETGCISAQLTAQALTLEWRVSSMCTSYSLHLEHLLMCF